jgi:hypothetical protein
MNGTVIFGVALIAAGLFFSGHTLPLLIGGVLVAAYGAFAPTKRPNNCAPRRLPSDADPWA